MSPDDRARGDRARDERLPFRMVDVFGVGGCSGNPVAVVHDAGDLTDDQMRRISAWTNLSECTFLVPPTDPAADYRVRIFNLELELPFAGHPTLGTARAWLDAGGEPRSPGTVVQECGVGLVPVREAGEQLAFAAPPTQRSGPVAADDLDAVLRVLRLDAEQVVDAGWVDNGPGWVAVLLDSAEAVLALEPDRSPAAGPRDIGVVGPHPPGAETSFELRAFFADGTDQLREDPVTGSLNASVAQWLIRSGRAQAPYVAAQGTRLGRTGRVTVTEGDGELWIGGRTDVTVSGTLDPGS